MYNVAKWVWLIVGMALLFGWWELYGATTGWGLRQAILLVPMYKCMSLWWQAQPVDESPRIEPWWK